MVISINLFVAVNLFLEEDSYTVSEAEGFIEICAVLEGMIARSIMVNITTMDDTASCNGF